MSEHTYQLREQLGDSCWWMSRADALQVEQWIKESRTDRSPAVENLKRHDVLSCLDSRPRWDGLGNC